MDYSELIKGWESENLYRFNAHHLFGKSLNEKTIDFLTIVGLPTSAAPFLSFAGDAENELSSIFDIYETGESIHKYILNIGSDGAGNPIYIHLQNEYQVITMNHGEDFEPSFMNSSVVGLFQFLTLYKRFVEKTIRTNREDAFLDADFIDRQYEELRKAMEAVDKKALCANTFRVQELEILLGNRDYYQNQK